MTFLGELIHKVFQLRKSDKKLNLFVCESSETDIYFYVIKLEPKTKFS